MVLLAPKAAFSVAQSMLYSKEWYYRLTMVMWTFKLFCLKYRVSGLKISYFYLPTNNCACKTITGHWLLCIPVFVWDFTPQPPFPGCNSLVTIFAVAVNSWLGCISETTTPWGRGYSTTINGNERYGSGLEITLFYNYRQFLTIPRLWTISWQLQFTESIEKPWIGHLKWS